MVENVAMVTRREFEVLSAPGGSHSLVDFDPELIAAIMDALNKPAHARPSFDVLGAISEACDTLAPYLGHFGKIPKWIGKTAAKEAARRKFEHALRVILRWTLNPETSLHKLSDLREIVKIVKAVVQIDIGLEVAEAIVNSIPFLLLHESMNQLSGNPQLQRYLAFTLRRLEASRKERNSAALLTNQRLVADGFEAALDLLIEPDPDAISSILQAMCTTSRPYLEAAHTVDANLMIPADPRSLNTRPQNGDAWRAFGDLLPRATGILAVTESTNSEFDHFWVPWIQDVRYHIPGAAAAYRRVVPEAVFKRHTPHFGEGLSPADVENIRRYLKASSFDLFISLPVSHNGQCVGVLNLNLYGDELKFHERALVHELHQGIRPMLAVLAKLLLLRRGDSEVGGGVSLPSGQ